MVRGKWVVITAMMMIVMMSWTEKVDGVMFNLPATRTKCLSEALYNDVVVLGEYFSFSNGYAPPPPTIAVEVKSPLGNTLHLEKNLTVGKASQFGFTTTDIGIYTACFWIDSPNSIGNVTVNIEWKNGMFTKDWESIAKAEKIEGLELELRKLEERVQAIRNHTMRLMIKDLNMQRVSQATNTKVQRFSFIAVAICIVVSALQVWQLKRFFVKKKLI